MKLKDKGIECNGKLEEGTESNLGIQKGIPGGNDF